MKSALGLFDVVRAVPSPVAKDLNIVGMCGVILGTSVDEVSGELHYAAFFEAIDQTVMLSRSEIEPTGESVDRDAFYNDRPDLVE